MAYPRIDRLITDCLQAEKALQASEFKFRSIFEFGAMGVSLLDLDGNFMLINPALQAMLGYEKNDTLPQSLKSLIHPADLASVMEMYKELAGGAYKLFHQENRFKRKDGSMVWANLMFSLAVGQDGRPDHVIGMFEDITYRKRIEAELREIKRQLIISQEKQQVMLAQELHDDPMQELYGVFFQLETLDESVPRDEVQAQIKLAKKSIEGVIQKLRVMCGQLRPLSLAPFGLEGAIREHMDKFREEHPSLNVTLKLSHDGKTLSEEVRITLFRIYQQALGNVIRHAQATHLTVHFSFDEHQATLEVEDNGIGFHVPHSWFKFTSEAHLGLAGAAERAELLGGKLVVRSSPGKGTLVRATVPLQSVKDPAIPGFF
ncbi:MAG: PAS domain-containing sensor histidine kinase [Chloroflexota bacterium]